MSHTVKNPADVGSHASATTDGGSRARQTQAETRRAVSARRDLGRARDELLAILRSRGARRAVPVRRGRQRDARRAARAHRVLLARLPARRRPGPALRLPRARAVGSGERASLQSRQAAARSVRTRDCRRHRLEPGDASRIRSAATTCSATIDDSAPYMPQVGRHRHRVRLGRRSAAAPPAARDGHLRGARQGLHASGIPRSRRRCAAPTPASRIRPRSST